MTALLLATTNPAKLARLRWVVQDLPFDIHTPAGLVPPVVPEDGPSFVANAAQKAEHWSAAADGLLTLATDGGLDIPALAGRWTALRTRRNAGPAADDSARIGHVLDLMRDLQGEQRRARWHEAIALARYGTVLRTWTASGDGGLIVEHYQPNHADNAFWTESIRYYPAAGKLYRDLTPEEVDAVDEVWPRMRTDVQAYLRALL